MAALDAATHQVAFLLFVMECEPAPSPAPPKKQNSELLTAIEMHQTGLVDLEAKMAQVHFLSGWMVSVSVSFCALDFQEEIALADLGKQRTRLENVVLCAGDYIDFAAMTTEKCATFLERAKQETQVALDSLSSQMSSHQSSVRLMFPHRPLMSIVKKGD